MIIRPSDTRDPLGPAGLGNVPTLGGDVTTAIPPAPGVPSAVQTQQSGTTSTQATAQAIVIPPPPYQVLSRLDPSGSLAVWFQTLSRKLGGYTTAYLSGVSVTAPITGDGTSTSPLALAQATATVPGYLAAADWATFNGKQAALGFTPANKAGDTFTGPVNFDRVGFFGTAALAAKPAALTAVTADAPAGGTGTAAGGWDTAAHRDTAIALINNLKTRVGDMESRLQSLGLLT